MVKFKIKIQEKKISIKNKFEWGENFSYLLFTCKIHMIYMCINFFTDEKVKLGAVKHSWV